MFVVGNVDLARFVGSGSWGRTPGAISSETDDVSHFLGGSRHSRCSRTMSRGLEILVLDTVNTRSLRWFWVESFLILLQGPLYWIRGWGLSMGSIPGASTLVMGNLMGRRFWVGC